MDKIELNEYGLAIWRNTLVPGLTAEQQYRWVDRVIILNANRTSILDCPAAALTSGGGWVPMTRDEYAALLKRAPAGEDDTEQRLVALEALVGDCQQQLRQIHDTIDNLCG